MSYSTTPHATDHAKVRRYLDGDESALNELIASIDADLRAFVERRIRGRSDLDHDDIVQKTYLYVLRRVDIYNPAHSFRSFVFGLAKTMIRRSVSKPSDLGPAPHEFDDGDTADWFELLSAAELESMAEAEGEMVGVGRFDAPDAARRASQVFRELFEVFLQYGGYPHQQVAFGFSILLWGKAKQTEVERVESQKVPLSGDPDRVVKEIGPAALGDASEAMLREVQARMKLAPEYMDRVAEPLRYRLALQISDLFLRDTTSGRAFAALADRRTLETLLQQYFGKDPRKSIADWTRTVKERVRKVFEDEDAARKIPLPHAGSPREL